MEDAKKKNLSDPYPDLGIINLRLTTFCEIDPWIIKKKWEAKNTTPSEQFQNPMGISLK
jgi:hypothetical protein